MEVTIDFSPTSIININLMTNWGSASLDIVVWKRCQNKLKIKCKQTMLNMVLL